ncbi:MAG: glucoamylase family protein [Microscillaceae bacterium]|nr:glucoamylase family protein [Microscillaceae bacterium]
MKTQRFPAIYIFIIFLLSGLSELQAQASKKMLYARPHQISDDSLLTLVQERTFQYFWHGAEPVSGLARERYHADDIYPDQDKHIVTTGGGGFGIMAILVGIERGFISRKQGFERLQQITDFLEKADRFHGVWPHWLHGETGKVKPFSKKDDGGDLVETAFLIQGLLCVRQYFAQGNDNEKALSQKIDRLWKDVEWNWHTNGKNVLYWHWSPNYAWEMNFAVEGYNECLIMYVLAAASPTHTIKPEVYHQGWARSGGIKGTTEKYGHKLTLKHNDSEEYGGPLFWSHYSFLGLDPRKLKDAYADYWEHNRNHVLIDWKYCIENPKNQIGYDENCWGLTSSYSPGFYAGHKPGGEDLGVISPTAALSSFPYTPEACMKALKYFYYELGDRIWGEFGFYDAFHLGLGYYPPRYLAIDQGPIVVMIENHRTGLLWDLFMSCPEVKAGLKKLGFSY